MWAGKETREDELGKGTSVGLRKPLPSPVDKSFEDTALKGIGVE